MLVYNQLLETQKTLEIVLDEETSFPEHVGRAARELVRVLATAYATFFKDCFCIEWMESALRRHGDMKETASGILYDLQWCRSVLCSILLKRLGQNSQALKPEDCDGMLSVTDRYALSTAVKKDQENLKALLRDLKANHVCSGECWKGIQVSEPCLATQLLKMLDFQAQPKSAQEEYYKGLPEHDRQKLSNWPLALLVSTEVLPQKDFVSSGSYGKIFKTIWLGEEYAMKMPKTLGSDFIKICKEEIAVLAGLHHPHVMHLVCCAEKDRKCSYVMDLMDMTLSELLEEHQTHMLEEHHKISHIVEAVGLLLQVAERVKYLHSTGLVHRDLKPQNILVKKVQEVYFDTYSENVTSVPLLNPIWIAKVSDFGTSKVKNESTVYKNQTLNIGTTLYMAPEVYELEEAGDEVPTRFHPMKTDVYSFGIMCWLAVTGKSTPFEDEGPMNFKTLRISVSWGKRPKLPEDCPARLSVLIQRCWDANPLWRPSFSDICKELRYIKGLLLTDDQTILTKPPQC